jgi:hypothetical protein
LSYSKEGVDIFRNISGIGSIVEKILVRMLALHFTSSYLMSADKRMGFRGPVVSTYSVRIQGQI